MRGKQDECVLKISAESRIYLLLSFQKKINKFNLLQDTNESPFSFLFFVSIFF